MDLGLPPNAKWHRVVTPSFAIDFPPWIHEVRGDQLQGHPIDGQGMISVAAKMAPPITGTPNIAALFDRERPVSEVTKLGRSDLDLWKQEFEYRVLWGLLGTYQSIVVLAYKEPTLVLCQFRDSVRRLPQWSVHVVDRMINSLHIPPTSDGHQ